MSDSKLFNEALEALYKAAKASANFVEVALTSKDIDFNPADKERLKTALSVLKITWLNEDDDDDDDEEYEDDEEDELHYIQRNN
ncbi:MAG: hypothetical protein HC836_04035 [Richelia sp. RM2_1_2]|nr:hypothetical protein [Richelia sp. SM1_7_0]NJN09764.1 hypothetical protein [Richelia sp. RM1_1_1]NJO29747.1 hypothetical protein [Richelia sp. SL_2_1]NJO57573.1 hypothetical protein [Richelia sp. RM2_1_2]